MVHISYLSISKYSPITTLETFVAKAGVGPIPPNANRAFLIIKESLSSTRYIPLETILISSSRLLYDFHMMMFNERIWKHAAAKILPCLLKWHTKFYQFILVFTFTELWNIYTFDNFFRTKLSLAIRQKECAQWYLPFSEDRRLWTRFLDGCTNNFCIKR